MPEASPGLIVLAELVDITEADLAVAALRASGIDASLRIDPRSDFYGSVANTPRRPSNRVIEIVVRAADRERGRQVLDEIGDDLPPEFHDDSIEAWSSAIEARAERQKARSRRIAITVIVALFVLIVVALVVGRVTSLLS